MAKTKRDFPPAKEKRVTIRLSDDLYSVLTENAHAARLTLSEYIRHVVSNQKIAFYPPVIRNDADILAELRSISKLGSNLNQIARYFNQNGHATDQIVEEIRSALAQINNSCARLNQAVEAEYGGH